MPRRHVGVARADPTAGLKKPSLPVSFAVDFRDRGSVADDRQQPNTDRAFGPSVRWKAAAITEWRARAPRVPSKAMAMSARQSEVFEAFRAIDIPKDKALKAATALGKRDDDVASIEAEPLLVKWMVGFVLAFRIAIAVKLFVR